MSLDNAMQGITNLPSQHKRTDRSRRTQELPQNISTLLNAPIAQDKFGRPASPISLLNRQKPNIQTYNPHKPGETEETKREAVPAQKTGKGVIA